jgi:hypothetical protein
MYGADPQFFHYGTKTGCRRLFAEQGVAHPLGQEDLHSTGEVAMAIAEMRAEHPDMAQVIVKLNEGVSGEGNALVDLGGLAADASHAEIEERVRAMQFESADVDRAVYLAVLERHGGVVEADHGRQFRSPSVQMRVTPLGRLECSRRTTSCWAGRAARAISAASSADQGTRRRSQR